MVTSFYFRVHLSQPVNHTVTDDGVAPTVRTFCLLWILAAPALAALSPGSPGAHPGPGLRPHGPDWEKGMACSLLKGGGYWRGLEDTPSPHPCLPLPQTQQAGA